MIPNAVVISPITPLPIGDDWQRKPLVAAMVTVSERGTFSRFEVLDRRSGLGKITAA